MVPAQRASVLDELGTMGKVYDLFSRTYNMLQEEL